MICCSQCSDWFHEICITEHIPKDIEQWIYVCKTCQQKFFFFVCIGRCVCFTILNQHSFNFKLNFWNFDDEVIGFIKHIS